MPSIDEHGVGSCHHKFENGVCFFCGELEKDSDPAIAEAIKLLIDRGLTVEQFERYAEDKKLQRLVGFLHRLNK